MHYRVDVGTLAVHSHMHLYLRRGLEARVRLYHLSGCVDLTDILGSHEALGHSGRGAKELVFTELNGNISVV